MAGWNSRKCQTRIDTVSYNKDRGPFVIEELILNLSSNSQRRTPYLYQSVLDLFSMRQDIPSRVRYIPLTTYVFKQL